MSVAEGTARLETSQGMHITADAVIQALEAATERRGKRRADEDARKRPATSVRLFKNWPQVRETSMNSVKRAGGARGAYMRLVMIVVG